MPLAVHGARPLCVRACTVAEGCALYVGFIEGPGNGSISPASGWAPEACSSGRGVQRASAIDCFEHTWVGSALRV